MNGKCVLFIYHKLNIESLCLSIQSIQWAPAVVEGNFIYEFNVYYISL